MLRTHNIIAWPQWAPPLCQRTDENYSTYVTTHLEMSARNRDRSCVEITYCSLEDGPSVSLHGIVRMNLPWKAQIAVRGWCLARAGYLVTRHRSGKLSAAKPQDCIFCGVCISHGMIHTFGKCSLWSSLRASFVQASDAPLSDARGITKAILSCTPAQPGLNEAILFAAAVDDAAADFWAGVAD